MKIYGLPVQHYIGRHMNCPAMSCEEAAWLCNELDAKIRETKAEMERWAKDYDDTNVSWEDWYCENDVTVSSMFLELEEGPDDRTRLERVVDFLTEWFYNISEGSFTALLVLCLVSALVAMTWALFMHATVGM